jgi:hypothetical protein
MGKRDVDCPRARSNMTPCIARDGGNALANEGVCVGCGAAPVALLTDLAQRYEPARTVLAAGPNDATENADHLNIRSSMAKQVLTQLVDDLDGGPADYADFTFALDGKTYEIDLSKENVIRLEGLLDEFIVAARRVRKQGPAKQPTRPASRDREQTRAVREWARRNGLEVADRGRIPASVVEAYENRAGRP